MPDLDMDALIEGIRAQEDKAAKKEAEKGEPKQEKPQTVEPEPAIKPALTSNEKARARNLGTELFTGGMKPLLDLQKRSAENKKMDPNPKKKRI